MVQFESRLQGLELFSQDDVIFGLVAKQQDYLCFVIRNAGDLCNCLVDGCDAGTAGYKEYPFHIVYLLGFTV